MAVTIVRSLWIDDDGTGTTGTVINQAVHTALYNEIDGALAKVAQLAGGNSFTGNQTIVGAVAVQNAGLTVANTTNVASIGLRCTAPGAGMGAILTVGNDIDPSLFYIQSFSSGFATDTQQIANGALIFGNGVGGLTVSVVQTNAPIKLHTRGIERMRIAPTGEVLINQPASTMPAKMQITSDQRTQWGLGIQSAVDVTSGLFVGFTNAAAAQQGLIYAVSPTTIAYATTSDARLKDDDGRATDLSALRTVVVHDFTWKADGIRDRGVFAQEAHSLYPRAVLEGTDETTDDGVTLARPWMTDYSKFVPDLIVGWQQHDAEIAELRAALAAAKG